MRRVLFLIFLIATLILGQGIYPPKVFALLREHHQSPGVLRYHAQHSIKDKQNRAWQVILFPEDRNPPTKEYYLRLVGFPGVVEVAHPQPLELITSQGNILIAPDAFSTASPATNVGQYNMSELISLLPKRGSLKLVLEISDENGSLESVVLKIGSSILDEWRILVEG